MADPTGMSALIQSRDMLVAAPESWDEACFAVPAVRAILASGLGTGVVCSEDQSAFWRTLPSLEVIDYSVKSKAKVLAGKIAPEWKASLVWQPGIIADAVKLAGIQRRVGTDHRKLKRLNTHTLAISTAPLDHRVRYYLSAVEELGFHTTQAEFFQPADIGIQSEPRAVVLSPDSDFGASHEWNLDGWLEIATRLVDLDCRITVVGLAGARGLGQSLAGKLGAGVEFFQASPMAGAMPTLAAHGLCIAADGSLPHLASHVGATCVTLFGPNDPAWKRTLGKRHACVHRHVECAPCLLPKCPLDSRCQNELTPDRVWSAVLDLKGK